jgi:hypothetical protein
MQLLRLALTCPCSVLSSWVGQKGNTLHLTVAVTHCFCCRAVWPDLGSFRSWTQATKVMVSLHWGAACSYRTALLLCSGRHMQHSPYYLLHSTAADMPNI